MNIFYVHTFFRVVWFERDVFSDKDPIVAFVFLLCVSLVSSVALEMLKSVLGGCGRGSLLKSMRGRTGVCPQREESI